MISIALGGTYMKKAIENFFSSFEEEFNEKGEFNQDLRFIKSEEDLEKACNRVVQLLEQEVGKFEANCLVECITDVLYLQMFIRDQYLFKSAFLQGVSLGVEINKQKIK